MRINAKRIALAAALLSGVAVPFAWGAGLFSTLPTIGGPAFCGSTNVSGNTQTTVTGQGGGQAPAGTVTGTVICGQTVPAGPVTFAGTEYAPFDLSAQGAAGGTPTQTAAVTALQLGQGPIIDNNVAGAAQTIPPNTGYFVLDTNTPATVAITLPANAIEGQIVHLVCGIAIGTALSVVANTGQTIKGQPTGTCAAGAGFAWRFSAVVPLNLSGASGAIVANSWVRIY
jgi:hypothetical protein